ncbi:hypothetical protein FHS18_001853 [Paenibacillus phyllosphaerae]|uniref:AbrB family transcriptional regulator n=1 Tax=Paenibacillus phyllosphaerae TaxID=274593 RepID=A0A7W5AVZ3_9BACL|nr:AbrB family transcriptional regulator [Paenibacillus phyllosphaerae]MBB3109790.1 hypothetical protein [Paenibacillus phyllosphaerae]
MTDSTPASAGTPAVRFLWTMAVALIGGILFSLLSIPIPWLLGPMLAIFLFSRTKVAIRPYWPQSVRNTGMIIVGYSIGLAFTASTVAQIGEQLPTMVLMTTLLLVFCAGIAWTIAKLAGLPFPTAITGSIPGGLTQMVTLADETEHIDVTVVTFLQVSRLMMIIFIVPMLIFSPLFGGQHDAAEAIASHSGSWSALFPGILSYAVICTAAALIGRRIHFPTAFMLCPLLATAALNLIGLEGPPLPDDILSASQFMIGGYIGMLLKPEQLQQKLRIITLALVSGAVLISGSIGLSLLLMQLHPELSAATAFLSLAPGGMDQMGIIAHEVGANLAVVTCYQLFRTLFIFLAVPPLLRILFIGLQRRARQQA